MRARPAFAGFTRPFLLAVACFFLVWWPRSAIARRVRVATWNVELGIGPADSVKYRAQEETLRRVDADIVALQELGETSSNEWARLAGELGYPHRAWGQFGPFSGDLVVGFYSRFPIVESRSVRSPPGVREISRLPLRIAVNVPGAARPLTLWTLHHKADFGPRDCFRRAIEARRVTENIQRYRARYPDRTELVVLGDMNDDPARPGQPETFQALVPHLPWSYRLGYDIGFPLRYRPFPTDPYRAAGLMPVPAYRQDTTNEVTHLHTNFRLDWIFVSDALENSPLGSPRGEVYHSDHDRGEGGLDKAGAVPPAGTSRWASDHYPVLADVHLEDAPVP